MLPTKYERGKTERKGQDLMYYLQATHVTGSITSPPYTSCDCTLGSRESSTREQQNSYYATRIGMPPDTSLNFQPPQGDSISCIFPWGTLWAKWLFILAQSSCLARQLGNGGYPWQRIAVSSYSCDSKRTSHLQEIP